MSSASKRCSSEWFTQGVKRAGALPDWCLGGEEGLAFLLEGQLEGGREGVTALHEQASSRQQALARSLVEACAFETCEGGVLDLARLMQELGWKKDIRQFILSHLGWEPGVVYHDYASLVGHPLSEVVMGDDGITRQLNSNWNVYFANYALAASPVMLFIVTEAWWLSPWCALEQRQRTEVKQAKQAPEGLRGYYRTDHSDPAAGIAGDISTAGYQQRHRQLEDELEAQRMEWRRADRDFGDLSEGVFRAVAFGNKRDEVYLFTEDPGGPEANATPFVQCMIPSPSTSVSIIPQTSALWRKASSYTPCLMQGLTLVKEGVAGKTFSINLVSDSSDDDVVDEKLEGTEQEDGCHERSETPQGTSVLWRLQALADLDALRAKEWADRKFEARLNQLHEKAISDGLRFETGPCPF
ncbi:hypothetical protein CYMTET_13725 [Cymbomonas tetramitiformis]|uniref:Uncharacterized protein n=1 Tax=Cymbomonas tetramitiformis TaxID=36881 RepID=A0AAE0GHX5_9CHLO|nr:hypothetical protein CYMTET_13725 [Cymbomonas tetramitiformis]